MSEGLESLLGGFAAVGQEPGCAVCVMRNGEVTEELNVGTRDGRAPWTTDTLVMTYSVAKPFAALTVLSAVAEGHLDLDGRVAEVWPAYAAHGKESTTVRHVLSHQAGLPCFPQEAASVDFDDADALTDLLATAVPEHPPGAAVAEHALTYGHLCDALVRPTTGETLAERFARIADAHGWDLHLRLRPEDLPRVADVVSVDPEWPGVYLDDPSWGPAVSRPAGLFDPAVLNGRDFRTTSFPAIALHASAGGLALFYDDLTRADGAVANLLGAELHREYVGPAATGVDRVIGREVTWTLGFQLERGEAGWSEIGMGGSGGCSAWASYENGYAAAYVTRGLGNHARGDAIWELLEGRGTGGTLGT